MAKELKTHDDRINWLAEELLLAKEQIASMASRIEALEHGQSAAPVNAGVSTEFIHYQSVWEQQASPHPLLERQEEAWALGQAVLLPRVAAVSFMLVVALILRTVTDNGMMGVVTGSAVGMAYALALIVAGVVLHGRGNQLAPVFPSCGALLLFAIIFETQNHFSSLSDQAGYGILLLAEIVIVWVGIYCQARVLLFLSVFASTAVGIALGFPNPQFVLLGLLILVNSIAAQTAADRNITFSLRWYALIFAAIFWMLWAYKLNFALKFEAKKVGALSPGLFLVLVAVFWLYYTGTSLWQTLKSEAPLGAFHHVLPAVAAGGGFFAVNAVLSPWVGKQQLIGTVAVGLSALYLGLVAWLAGRGKEDIPGGKEFVTAATILLIQGLAIAVPPLWALPVWTAAAAVLTVRADRWRSGGIRVISYLFQIFVLIYTLRNGAFGIGQVSWPTGLSVAGMMAACTLWLYRWCRLHPPKYDSAFFTVFDRNDVSAVILLCLGLYQSFAALRFAVFPLVADTLARSDSAFSCVQSVLLNIGIVVLLVLGLRGKKRELVTVAGCVILVAAVKVFILDLFRASGVPLVMSVFSFGIVAATGSVVLRKWQGASAGEAIAVSEN